MLTLNKAYKATDGKIFEDRIECLKHNAVIFLKGHYRDCLDPEAFNWLIENHVDMRRHLEDLHKSILEK